MQSHLRLESSVSNETKLHYIKNLAITTKILMWKSEIPSY